MITKEAIEAACAALNKRDRGNAISIPDVVAMLTAAFAAMPGPVVIRNDDAGFVEFVNEDRPYIVREINGPCAILTDMETRNVIGYRVYDHGCSERDVFAATDLASENERLRAALEFVQLWAWRDDPPNAARNLSDSERLSAIKYHPSIRPGRAALERT